MTKGLPKVTDFAGAVEAGVAVTRRHARRLKDVPPETRTKADKSPVTAADL